MSVTQDGRAGGSLVLPSHGWAMAASGQPEPLRSAGWRRARPSSGIFEVEVDESIRFDPLRRTWARGAAARRRGHEARPGRTGGYGRIRAGRPGQHEGAASHALGGRVLRPGDHRGERRSGAGIRIALGRGFRREVERARHAQPAADARDVFRPVPDVRTGPARHGTARRPPPYRDPRALARGARGRAHAAVLRSGLCAVSRPPEPLHIRSPLTAARDKVRKLVLIGLAQALLVLAGCGGSSGSGVVISTGNNGGGSGGGGGTPTNTITMTVDSGPDPSVSYDVDTPFITVTVCAPGSTTNCQVINHIEVDSGSYGLRILSSVLNPSLASALQQQTAAGGNSVVECTEFADGFTWGPVKVADVQIGGESASNVPMQIMGDPAYAQSSTAGGTTTSEIPTACSSTGPEEDTVSAFGANGIIGIGVFADDCGPACDTSVSGTQNPGFYYQCPASTWSPANPCSEIAIAESAQVTDPVFLFQTDNNGVIVEFPSVPEGSSTASGTLIFGIGTQGNNMLNATTMLTANPSYGDVNATYTTHGGQQQFLPYSYFDTGSNAYYFADDSIPAGQSC